MTHARPGARGASGRIPSVLVLLLVATACQPAEGPDTVRLRETETIIGRASWRGQDMLLTDAPALLAINRVTGALGRTSIMASPDVRFAPWGLAEVDDALFTVSGFRRLTRLAPDGSVAEVATLSRPLANLIDLPEGMAAQLSSEPAGSPLLVRLRGSGDISALESPARAAAGLTPAEESLLHLVACSAPPRVICWLPNDNRLLVFAGGALVEGPALEGLDPIPAATLISQLDRRVIVDAMATDDGHFVVLHGGYDESFQHVTTFDLRGRRVGSAPAPEPLRVLVSSERREILAISRNGHPKRIHRP